VKRDHVASLNILTAIHGLESHLVAPGVALVTFELGAGSAPGRRTLLWTWDAKAARWQLWHLHASRMLPDQ
jgi:hypothetical protein